MRAFLGETRDPEVLARASAAGLGTVIQRGSYRAPPDRPWIYDNRVFADWKAGKPWTSLDELEYVSDVARMTRRVPLKSKPVFVVLPDAVGDSRLTWKRGIDVLGKLSQLGLIESLPKTEVPRPRHTLRFAYVVQNGETPAALRAWLAWWPGITTLFVGGSTEWKLATAPSWARFAHDLGLKCHVGRVGSARRVAWAHAAGADSIDSCLPLWSSEKLGVFLGALHRCASQGNLGLG